MNKEFGGYFEISIDEKHPYHKNAVELNTGRNCFEYILLTNKIKKGFYSSLHLRSNVRTSCKK